MGLLGAFHLGRLPVHGRTMNRWTRFVPLTPVLLAPLVVVAIALSPSRPPSTASGQEVISFYLANPTPRLLSAYLGSCVASSGSSYGRQACPRADIRTV
jgi:hypothetical protein